MMELADFLKEARILIALPDNWIKGTSWATEAGMVVLPDQSQRHLVSKRCMLGALSEVAFAHSVEEGVMHLRMQATHLLTNVIKYQASFPLSVPSFNDAPGVTHEHVLDVFDQAIAEAQE